jgi:hypothetical protein
MAVRMPDYCRDLASRLVIESAQGNPSKIEAYIKHARRTEA